MFIGKYLAKLSKENRLNLPVDILKNIHDDTLILTVIDNDTLLFFPSENWEPEKILLGSVIPKEKKDKYIKYILSNSYALKILSQGRVVIPKIVSIALSSELKDQALFIGNGEYFSLVNYKKYKIESELSNSDVESFNEFLNSESGVTYKKKISGIL